MPISKMKTRRRFLVTSLGAGLLGRNMVMANADDKPPLFSFGLMADCQYVDAATRGSRFYRESPKKLAAAVAELNKHELAFNFHLGDFIDCDLASFDVVTPIAAKLRGQLYHALGNHDYDVKDDEKPLVPGKLGLKNGYYSFEKDNFRFIVIDTTDVSPYRYKTGSEEHQLAIDELARFKKLRVAGAVSWNGRPGNKQLEWLKAELVAATTANQTVLIFGHHPVLPAEGHSIWNSKEVADLLKAYPCVKMYINGHNHKGHYLDAKGVHYLTLDGMLETKDSNAFALAYVYQDRLEVAGFGRQESHVLRYRN